MSLGGERNVSLQPSQSFQTSENWVPAREDVIALLRRLVAIPSMNPYDEAPDDPRYGEGTVAAFLVDWFARAGIETQTSEVLPGRPNVLAQVPGTAKSARTLLLQTHTDTVPAPWIPRTGNPEARVDGDLLWGLGSCDAKGCLTAMMLALEYAASQRPSSNLALCAAVDEEHAFRGVLHLLRNGFRADAAIVGEPTEHEIVVAHKGVIRFRIAVHGKAGHAATPNHSENAILQMANVIQELATNYLPALATRSHPKLGPATANIGRIWGGTQVNVVPDQCTIDVDRRYLPDEDAEQVLREIDEALAAVKLRIPHLEFTREEPYLDSLPLGDHANASVAAALQASHRNVTDTETRVIGVPFGTDASKIQAAGIPCVVYGPGSISNAHKPSEHVEISSVQRAAAVYAHWLLHTK